MNILQLTLSFKPGGRRSAIRTLASFFKFQGVQTDLACVEELGCSADMTADFGMVSVLNRPQIGTRKAIAKLARLCDERGINLIHAHDAASQFLGMRLRLARPKIKLVMTFHRSLGFESAGWKAKARNAFAGVGTQAVIVGSRERQRHYLAENYIARAKVVRIPFGIDLSRFRRDAAAREVIRREAGVEDQIPLVGAVGHFGEEKGIDLAIGAFASLLQNPACRRAKLMVIGRGTEQQEKALRELAAPAAQAIHFAGWRPDVERYFSAMDIFLHLPRQEAFGLVVAEAMASRLPVVAADVGGVPDMVRHDLTGMLVEAGSPWKVATALGRLIEDQPLRERMAGEALRVAQSEYSDALYGQRHLELYQALLAGRMPHGIQECPATDNSIHNGLRHPLPSV